MTAVATAVVIDLISSGKSVEGVLPFPGSSRVHFVKLCLVGQQKVSCGGILYDVQL